ncbi:MAG: hypothetical protein ACRDRZ_15390 [Pseudonocardiaceae bacterium]
MNIHHSTRRERELLWTVRLTALSVAALVALVSCAPEPRSASDYLTGGVTPGVTRAGEPR